MTLWFRAINSGRRPRAFRLTAEASSLSNARPTGLLWGSCARFRTTDNRHAREHYCACRLVHSEHSDVKIAMLNWSLHMDSGFLC